MKAIHQYDLSGPTYFHEIIHVAKECAKEYVTQEKQKYFILLIITDGRAKGYIILIIVGVIESIDKTIKEIIESSDYPLSIVIVGVGSADFDSMEKLDADKTPLSTTHRGRTMLSNSN